LKAIKVITITASVQSQVLCHLATKMTCGLKSLTLADSEVGTVRIIQV